jgi:DNA polymerase-3 subunit alpha
LLDECEFIDFNFGENKNLRTFTGSIDGDKQKLLSLCKEGMRYRYPNSTADIEARFKKEIDLITEKEFTSYFLINHDLVDYARHKNYFYVGRGSGANSMVAYLLKITDVDPIDLDLYFERFINPSRKNPPDFDIDFSSDERDDVIDYIFHRSPYGKQQKNQVALLATYSEMKDNSLMRELGKVFGLPKAEIDALQENRNHPQTPDHITRLIHQYGRYLFFIPQPFKYSCRRHFDYRKADHLLHCPQQSTQRIPAHSFQHGRGRGCRPGEI